VAELDRLFAYDRWANREALESIRAGKAPALARRLMAHVVAAESLWLARLEHAEATLTVWPDLSLARCAELLDDLERRWAGYLADLTPERRAASVAYVNSKGEPFESTVDEILTHVVIHSAYHRGQIAAAVRAAGRQPAYTDFIHAVRSGKIA
jgi:uncharacterized damage-inducible protein DinB